MQIDMPKVSFGIGVAVMIETAIGGGTLSLTNMIPAHLIPGVQAWCNAFAFVGAALLTGLHAYSGPSTGVLASPPTVAQAQQIMTVAKTAATVLLLALVLWPADALAQTPRPRAPLTGDPVRDIKNAIGGQEQGPGVGGSQGGDKLAQILAKPFNELADFINTDAADAATLATAIPGLQDGHGQQCWMAMSQFTAVIKAHPIPLTLHAATDLEAFRLANMAANNLCSNVHCTQVFSDLSNAVQQVAGQIGGVLVTGGLQIPSLNSLCSKVPQVIVAAPIAVPAAAPPTPAPAPTQQP